MTKFSHKLFKIIGLLSLFSLLSSCSLPGLSAAERNPNSVRVAATTSTESQILAYMISDLIEHETNLHTSIVNNMGSASMMHEALVRRNADIQSTSFNGTELTGTLQMSPTKDPQKATHEVRRELKKRYDQTYYPTYGFADTYAFMVKQKTAQKYQLQKVSDLSKVAQQFSVGVDSIWLNHKGDGYKDFVHYYGFEFKRAHPMQIGLVYSALAANKMDVVLGYSTDGRIDSYHLQQLKDDKRFFPPYQCSLVVNNYLLREHPQLRPLLHRLDDKINLHTMRKLNYQVDDQLLEPQVAAHQFLVKNNYFRGEK
ncbi:osmoprotectant ABC transporter substrate-binding protein [Bombilactobacillus bombi]|uniref:Osmoprotectant ABC transporter substrate-binding protein n=1 Tax=Bombilactobacillus bombi TaxID=1303590 RepID=A0A3R6VHD5_9LACO|nr:osmoprotectant ABC transporter substrate-binding protein [Bombilactobacillus bombi]RHW48202.1 osmoprotectant ABC transporter substrate-binding protein [Bombilactobacillus bombi]